MIRAVLFDFGGVIADEGFLKGLQAIGRANGLDPDEFFKTVEALIYETGYLTGNADEAFFWNAVREKTGIRGADAGLKAEIQKRFSLRPEMVALADKLRSQGFVVAILSDQTNWLEETDQETGLFRHFDRVFNSYRTHKSKRDSSVFPDVCAALGFRPEETLFIDDTLNHIKRAQGQGLQTIHFTEMDDFKQRIGKFVDIAED